MQVIRRLILKINFGVMLQPTSFPDFKWSQYNYYFFEWPMSSLKHILNIIKFSGSYKKSCRSCNFQDFEWSQFIFLQLADVAAFDGKFSDAAKLYKKVGQEQKALSMYTDLRMFDLVRNYDNLCV
jgi:hypothetical protein